MRILTEADAAMRYHLFDTALGVCGVAWSEQGLTRLQRPEATPDATARRLRGRSAAAMASAPPRPVAKAIAHVERYLAGEQIDFARVALDLSGVSDFHRKVYQTMRSIGWGQTTSYGALAQWVGSPEAARAVGQAMGRNPIPVIIPCHRVLASGGKVGGFSAFGGADTKQRLLALEGVYLAAAPPRLPGL